MTKLTNLLSEMFEDVQKVDKHQVIEGVKTYGKVGQSLYGNNIMEVAQQLSKIAESAHGHILGEQDDWFDKVSVNKNMGFLKGSVKEFKKTAQESHALNQRLQGLYEDIGHVLNRYYEIDENVMTEKMDPVGQEDGDIDNDGDTDSSDEYLANRRDTIGKAIKGEDVNERENIGTQIDRDTGASYLQKAKERAVDAKKASDLEKMKKGAVARDFVPPRPVGAKSLTQGNYIKDPEIVKQGKIYKPVSPKPNIDIKAALEKGGHINPDGTIKMFDPSTLPESTDARMLRLAGITKENTNKPTKRLSDIKDVVVNPSVVGGLNKKF